MAKIKDNLAMQGISGKLGNQVVYRRVGDKIIVVAKPRRKPTTHPTLISQNNRFRLASTYAKNALQDPVLKDLYTAEAKRRGVINAYNMAAVFYLKKDCGIMTHFLYYLFDRNGAFVGFFEHCHERMLYQRRA